MNKMLEERVCKQNQQVRFRCAEIAGSQVSGSLSQPQSGEALKMLLMDGEVLKFCLPTLAATTRTRRGWGAHFSFLSLLIAAVTRIHIFKRKECFSEVQEEGRRQQVGCR
jgi:hypothetical protein